MDDMIEIEPQDHPAAVAAFRERPASDRLAEIKRRSDRQGFDYDDGLWLVAEIERLRPIEKAAHAWADGKEGDSATEDALLKELEESGRRVGHGLF